MKSGTSIKEQALFYFVKKFFPNAENRSKIEFNNKKYEVDIIIPDILVAIEYDGSYWHKNKVKRDNEKNKALNSLGYEVIRIREFGLPKLNDFVGELIELKKYKLNEENYDYINYTLNYLRRKEKAKERNISKYEVDHDVYNSALKFIYSALYSSAVEPNIADMCGIECWDEEKNSPLNPNNVGVYEWVPAVMICPNGNEIELPRYRRDFKSDCAEEGNNCLKCLKHELCPFITYCKKKDNVLVECQYVEKIVWNMIKEGKVLQDYIYGVSFKQWLKEESNLSKKIIDKYKDEKTSKKLKENIACFLGAKKEFYKKVVKNDKFCIDDYFDATVRSYFNGIPDKDGSICELWLSH